MRKQKKEREREIIKNYTEKLRLEKSEQADNFHLESPVLQLVKPDSLQFPQTRYM